MTRTFTAETQLQGQALRAGVRACRSGRLFALAKRPERGETVNDGLLDTRS
jgi:hypothetical protein